MSRCGLVGTIFFENTNSSEQYTETDHEFLGCVIEREIIAGQSQQHSAKYQSTGNHARVIPILRRSNHFESNMAPMFDRLSHSDFAVCGYGKDNANRTQSELNENQTIQLTANISPMVLQALHIKLHAVLHYVCNMLVHTFITFCKRIKGNK